MDRRRARCSTRGQITRLPWLVETAHLSGADVRVSAWLTLSVNNAKWRPRERVGLGAVTGLDLLDGLLGLPLGLPVPVEVLTTPERQLVCHLPHGVVEQRVTENFADSLILASGYRALT